MPGPPTIKDLKRILKPDLRGDPTEIKTAQARPIYQPQAQANGRGENTFPVRALKGERREIDGCMRVVRILFLMSDGKAYWVSYEDLLQEGSWETV